MRIPVDGHTLCLRHAPCTADFKLFDPQKYSVCAAIVSIILHCTMLTGLELEHVASHCHCNRSASWANPNLPLLLGFDYPSRASPLPSLKTLLKDQKWPPPEFSGFLHEATTSDLPTPNAAHSSALPPSTIATTETNQPAMRRSPIPGGAGITGRRPLQYHQKKVSFMMMELM